MFGVAASLVKPEPQKVVAVVREDLQEYEKLAHDLGVDISILRTNRFLEFMAKHDLPIYDLPTVVRYMDRMAKRDGDGSGWLWRPMGQQDTMHIFRHNLSIEFGKPGRNMVVGNRPASDFYNSNFTVDSYKHPIPLRVLKRAKFIKDNIPGQFSPIFFISDYATKLDMQKRPLPPDPFLMVYLPEIKERYVIDFWDEPGFGILDMVAGASNG